MAVGRDGDRCLNSCLGSRRTVGLVSGASGCAAPSRPGTIPARRLSRVAVWLGRGLIVVQFALSAILVVVTITMARQLDFMRTKDLGFDGDQVVLVYPI